MCCPRSYTMRCVCVLTWLGAVVNCLPATSTTTTTVTTTATTTTASETTVSSSSTAVAEAASLMPLKRIERSVEDSPLLEYMPSNDISIYNRKGSSNSISASEHRNIENGYLRAWRRGSNENNQLTASQERMAADLTGDHQLSWQLAPQVGKRPKRLHGAADTRLMESALEAVGREAASSVLARQQRTGRMYDVPQIECPRSPDHTERFACPRPDRRGRFRCIDDRSLCDGFYDCPGKEDESPEHCLFFKTTKAHLDILAEALLRWARGR